LVTSAFGRILFSSIGNNVCSAEFCFQALASEFRNFTVGCYTRKKKKRGQGAEGKVEEESLLALGWCEEKLLPVSIVEEGMLLVSQ
jgi:hypothetical protein